METIPFIRLLIDHPLFWEDARQRYHTCLTYDQWKKNLYGFAGAEMYDDIVHDIFTRKYDSLCDRAVRKWLLTRLIREIEQRGEAAVCAEFLEILEEVEAHSLTCWSKKARDAYWRVVVSHER